MSGSAAPILVTGATGRHGSTGAHVARRLREEGRPVRILARTLSERTDALAELGAEVVIGDLHDRRGLVTALTDVELAYFTYPVEAGVVPAAANYTAAVRETGRAIRTVVMSMGPAHPLHPSDLGRAQWLAEEVMAWGGLDVLILRVGATFHQNLIALHGHSIRRENLLRNSFGDGQVGWINGSDAGELAVAALLRPSTFDGPVCYPTGSELLTTTRSPRSSPRNSDVRSPSSRSHLTSGATSLSALPRIIPVESSTPPWPATSPMSARRLRLEVPHPPIARN